MALSQLAHLDPEDEAGSACPSLSGTLQASGLLLPLVEGEGEVVSCHAVFWGLPHKVSVSSNSSCYYVLALC